MKVIDRILCKLGYVKFIGKINARYCRFCMDMTDHDLRFSTLPTPHRFEYRGSFDGESMTYRPELVSTVRCTCNNCGNFIYETILTPGEVKLNSKQKHDAMKKEAEEMNKTWSDLQMLLVGGDE